MATKEMIAVMQAFVDGKPIQSARKGEPLKIWLDDKNPIWDWHNCYYRIKTEPDDEQGNLYVVGKKYKCVYRSLSGLMIPYICTYEKSGFFNLCHGQSNFSKLYTDGIFPKSEFVYIKEIVEPEYRPYKNCAEFIAVAKTKMAHGNQLFSGLYLNANGCTRHVDAYSDTAICVGGYGDGWASFDTALKQGYTYLDGTPFGIMVTDGIQTEK